MAKIKLGPGKRFPTGLKKIKDTPLSEDSAMRIMASSTARKQSVSKMSDLTKTGKRRKS